MTVFWDGLMADGTTPNRFAAKHLHLVDAHVNVDRMKQEGHRILNERNGFVMVVGKNAKYGKIKPKANTLVVTNRGGLNAMEAWVDLHVHASGHFSIPVGIGVIVQNNFEEIASMNVFAEDAKTGGSIDVNIEVSGSDRRVFHMRGIDDQGIELQDYKMNKGGVSFSVTF
ncbi:MAG TPA: hypothetical protein VF861_14640 [Telluria sp.]